MSFLASPDLLTQILAPHRLSHVADVGANPIDGEPPYKSMLESGLCRVTGFEPQLAALEDLNLRKGPLETYLPHALGLGGSVKLNVCNYSGWTSQLLPSQAALNVFPFFKANAQVVSSFVVPTRRMDDLPDLAPFDLLKIDVQGAELDIFEGGTDHLRHAVAVQTEVSFIPLYENQPAFGVIDATLRSLGFLPHCFAAIKTGPLGPLDFSKAPQYGFKQLIEADLVYFKNLIEPQDLTDEQIKHLALLAYHCYQSVDIVGRCLQVLQERGACPPDAIERFVGTLNQTAK